MLMRTNAIRLSQKEQALLRRQAIRLRQAGKSNSEVGDILGVHTKTVGRWWTAYRQVGEQLFETGKRGRRKGAQRRLTAVQEREVQRLISDKMPDQLKLPFALWTRGAVSELIEQKYGVKLPVRTMGEYLHRWGYTPQKPQKRAYEQKDAAVSGWLQETYPKIVAQAKQEGAEIFWGDQTGVNAQPNVARGYAPRGRTPVVKQMAKQFSLSMMSAVTNRGTVRFFIYKGALNVKLLVQFCRRLITSAQGRKVYLILDNLPVHHAKVFCSWVEERAEQITVFYLPSYSPQLNPDEQLNRDLKGTLSRKPSPRDQKQLHKNLLSHLRSLQKLPTRVQGYFRTTHTAYAS